MSELCGMQLHLSKAVVYREREEERAVLFIGGIRGLGGWEMAQLEKSRSLASVLTNILASWPCKTIHSACSILPVFR